MGTLAATSTGQYMAIRLATERATQFIDLTERLHALVADSSIAYGLLNVQSLHTTTAIVVNEHEPLLLTDFTALLEKTAPHGGYRHDDLLLRTMTAPDERVNGHAHCRALLLPPSVCLNIVDGALQLGQWQRVFFVELDGPRERELSVLIVGEVRG